jgi:hypothetical protein
VRRSGIDRIDLHRRARTKFFCAIHLAGAAGELFDAHLQKSEQFFTSAWKAEKTLKSETGQVPNVMEE